MKTIRYKLLVLILLIPAQIFAQTDPNTPATLNEYLQIASLNNADLRAKFDAWKAAFEQIIPAGTLPDPQFTYGYYIREVETRVGPQEQSFALMQKFPWFGTLSAKRGSAAAEAKAAKAEYDTAKLKLFSDIKAAYYEYIYLASAIDIAKENLQLLEHFEEVARAKYEAATAMHPDLIRAQVELAKTEDVLNSLKPLRKPITAKLNALMNRPIDVNLPWPQKEQLRQVVVDRKQVCEMVKANNPQLSQLDFKVNAAHKRVEEAEKKFYPDLGVGVMWIDTGEAINPSLKDSGNDPVILTFSMNIPLWRNSYQAGENSAKAMARMYSNQKIDRENTLLVKTEQVIYDLDDSDRKIRLYRDVLIPKAQELLTASETAYQSGTVDFLSLIDAQRMLLSYSLAYEKAVRDYRQRLAELSSLTGIDLAR
ncbi:MAG: TolC family protein [Phycisphaerae bacterium]|nr:TolC family protein [Phycisphaerae bacterium]